MTTNAQIKNQERKQPNSRHCFVCGLENEYGLGLRFYEIGPDEVTATVSIPEQYQGYPGVVHGGITAAMLDEVLGRAAMVGDCGFPTAASAPMQMAPWRICGTIPCGKRTWKRWVGRSILTRRVSQ
jgi:hypothetical protein